MIASLVTTFNRREALARSLPPIAALGWPTLVVDDGTKSIFPLGSGDFENGYIAKRTGVEYLPLPQNRGLAAAMNIGLSYLLADPGVEWVSYFQDDVDLAPTFKSVFEEVVARGDWKETLLTGHDAAEHPGQDCDGLWRFFKSKTNCRATHLFAHRDYWLRVMPIPTRKLGAPCREPGQERGTGSNVDWWIAREAPGSAVKRGQRVICLPGLVRTFLWEGKDSNWGNTQRAGADPEFEARP